MRFLAFQPHILVMVHLWCCDIPLHACTNKARLNERKNDIERRQSGNDSFPIKEKELDVASSSDSVSIRLYQVNVTGDCLLHLFVGDPNITPRYAGGTVLQETLHQDDIVPIRIIDIGRIPFSEAVR